MSGLGYRRSIAAAVLAGVGLVLMAAGQARAATSISTCPVTLTAAGEYVLAMDLTCPGTAITIAGNNVRLNLNGHTLTGTGGAAGVIIGAVSGAAVYNGTITGFGNGVFIATGSSGANIQRLKLAKNTFNVNGRGNGHVLRFNDCTDSFVGIGMSGDDHRICFNRCYKNVDPECRFGYGIAVDGNRIRIVCNDTRENTCAGIGVFAGGQDTISNNTSVNNGREGVILFGYGGNTVVRNKCSQNVTVQVGDEAGRTERGRTRESA